MATGNGAGWLQAFQDASALLTQLRPCTHHGAAIDLSPQGLPDGSWRPMADIASGPALRLADASGQSVRTIELNDGDQVRVGPFERLWKPEDLAINWIGRSKISVARASSESAENQGFVYFCMDNYMVLLSAPWKEGWPIRNGSWLSTRKLYSRLSLLDSNVTIEARNAYDDLNQEIEEIVEAFRAGNRALDPRGAVISELLCRIADRASLFGYKVGLLEEQIQSATIREDVQNSRDRRSLGGKKTTEKRREWAADDERKAIDLALTRIRDPLPQGNKRWTLTLLAELVASQMKASWRSPDRASPSSATIRKYLKKARDGDATAGVEPREELAGIT